MVHFLTLRSLSVVVPAMLFSVAGQIAYAEEEILPLMKEKVCMSCHLVDKKRVGPSLNMIAERYYTVDDETVAMLSERIKKGGKGNWGPVAMPTQNALSEEDAQTIARWLLQRGAKIREQALLQKPDQESAEDLVDTVKKDVSTE